MTDAITIRPLSSAVEAEACARLMSSSEPWVTLGRTYEIALERFRAPDREIYLAIDSTDGERVAGFIILCLVGAFTGYIQSVAVDPAWRGKGVGTLLIRFAEERILREHPNVFLCVSSFNPDARRLYERLGYRVVGALDDFVVRGHAEILMRKAGPPLAEFEPRR